MLLSILIIVLSSAVQKLGNSCFKEINTSLEVIIVYTAIVL